MKNKPIFRVLVHNTNSGKIEWMNVFESPFWDKIKKELKKEKRRKGFCLETARYVLNGECSYYFWSKAEWEVVVKEWVGKPTSVKIDVYEQLKANWALFEMLAFSDAGITNET